MRTSKKKLLFCFILAFCTLLFNTPDARSQEYTITRLTDNAYYDSPPQIHNGQVVWSGWNGNDYEISLYSGDGTPPREISNNSDESREPQIHDGQVVWSGWDGNDVEIFLYNGDGTPPIKISHTDNAEDYLPQIHNGQVAWEAWDYSAPVFSEIFFFDGIQASNISTDRNAPSNNVYYDEGPKSTTARWYGQRKHIIMMSILTVMNCRVGRRSF